MWDGRPTLLCSESSHNHILAMQLFKSHVQDLPKNTIPETVSSKRCESIAIRLRFSEKQDVIKLYVNKILG